MTDKQRQRAAMSDPDALPLTPADFKRMKRTPRAKIIRRSLGLTQEEFAHAIAVTVSTVNRWENSHAAPSKLAWKVIRELARKRGLADHLHPGTTAVSR